jgi:hypothetical protein
LISHEKGIVMALIARILGVSLGVGALGAVIGLVLFQGPYSDYIVPVVFLASVGAVIGAIAGAAREIVRIKGDAVNR